MSSCKPVVNGVPQVCIPGSTLLNIFISDMDNEMECTLQVCRWHNLNGTIDLLEWKDDVQKNLDWFEEWADVNLMKFSKANFKVLNLGQAILNIYTHWVNNWLRVTLGGRTWRYWEVKNYVWIVKVPLKLRKPAYPGLHKRNVARKSGSILPLFYTSWNVTWSNKSSSETLNTKQT